MLDVEAALLVPLDQRAPGVLQRRVVVGRQQHRRARRQVVEQRGRVLEEERQVVLDACRREAFADVAVERHARQVALETRAEATPEVLDRLGRQAELARGQQVEPRQLLERALRLGVEAADAVDDVVEQVDAQRRVAAHREHVEQRAADREVARFGHLRHARVARAREPQPELLEVERLAGLQAERMAVDERAWRQALQRGRQVDDDDAAFERGQSRHRAQALRDDVGVRRELVVRQRLVAGEGEDRGAGGREEAEFLLETSGASAASGVTTSSGPRASRRGTRDVQSRRGAGQAGPAQARAVGGGQWQVVGSRAAWTTEKQTAPGPTRRPGRQGSPQF